MSQGLFTSRLDTMTQEAIRDQARAANAGGIEAQLAYFEHFDNGRDVAIARLQGFSDTSFATDEEDLQADLNGRMYRWWDVDLRNPEQVVEVAGGREAAETILAQAVNDYAERQAQQSLEDGLFPKVYHVLRVNDEQTVIEAATTPVEGVTAADEAAPRPS